MIELGQLGCRVRGRWVLREVSLEVGAGEVVGLTGPNGGGKSLLLAICATLVRPDAGSLRLAGVDARAAPAAARRLIGYVPDEVGCDPRMTVREDLQFFAAAHGLPARARRAAVEDALARWRLDGVAEARMSELSRGLARRVALARAWLHRPRILLLDEPAAGLDAESRATLDREVDLHAEAGGAALVATHDVERLARAGRRIGVLVAGELRDGGVGALVPPRDGVAPASLVTTARQ